MADNASKTKQASSYKGYNNIIAVHIRELMKSSGTTQQELAENIGCSRQAIAQYTDGSNAPNIDKLVSIAKYFDVSLDYLVGLSNAQTADKDIQYICDYTGLSMVAVEQLHIISSLASTNEDDKKLIAYMKEHSKRFLYYMSEFATDRNFQEITMNITAYLELVHNSETLKEDINAPFKSIEENKIQQEFTLFRISRNIQKVVENICEKERNSNGNN